MNDATEQSFISTFGEQDNEPVASESLDLAIQDYFEAGTLSPKVISTMRRVAAKGLEAVFKFCLEGRWPVFGEKELRVAMRRFVAVAWLLHSEMMVDEEGKILTLERLAALPQLDCTKCALSINAQTFGKQYSFHGRVQKRAGSKENYATAAKKGWEKRQRSENPKQRPRPANREPGPPPASKGRCRRCHEVKDPSCYEPGKLTCLACAATGKTKLVMSPRVCVCCKVLKPAAEYDRRFRTCRSCVASRKPPEMPIGSPE